jgi:3-oxoacyl-[acyl-carrier protein] reductase
MEIDLKGKKALVCGSTQGIGKAIALEFAKSGAQVTLLARNESSLKKVISELPNSELHSYLLADFSKPEELKQILKQDENSYHILINNTGGPPGGTAIEAETDQFVAAFQQHLICNHLLVQHCVEGMKTAKYGRIINIISTSVKQPLNGLGVSNTIRGAVANWSKTLANELGAFGITVNNVLPGATETERLESIINNKTKAGKSEEEVRKAMLSSIPAGRFAKAEELAYAATFLASDKASYINGTNVVVDGGRTSSL